MIFIVSNLFFFFGCRSLDGLERFTQLEELVLDNNSLDDNVMFPRLNHLHTLTINKNSVSLFKAEI